MYYIQLNGKMAIPFKLDEEKDVSFVCKRAGLKTISRKPESVDGEEEEITYKYQNRDEVTVIQEDKVVFGKPKKGSQSQVLRLLLGDIYNEQWAGGDDYSDSEDFYKREMSKIIESYKSKLV
jgi:hypothetical protein